MILYKFIEIKEISDKSSNLTNISYLIESPF